MLNDASKTPSKCGFVALIGATNAGKSTLLNALVEQKVAIVSRKSQTTRGCSVGIISSTSTQLLLRDTPGFFNPTSRLGEVMVESARAAAACSDLVAIVHDAKRGISPDLVDLVERMLSSNPILVLNKIDLIERSKLLEYAAWASEREKIAAVFMVSALTEDGIDDLRQHMLKTMPPGPWLYPNDQVTDQPMSRLAAELTREQLFDMCHDELPYSLSVETVSWREQPGGVIRIEQVVFVSRKSHKPMIIGAGGRVLKSVGTRSRLILEEMLRRKVFLSLRVKVHGQWDRDVRHLEAMGIRGQ